MSIGMAEHKSELHTACNCNFVGYFHNTWLVNTHKRQGWWRRRIVCPSNISGLWEAQASLNSRVCGGDHWRAVHHFPAKMFSKECIFSGVFWGNRILFILGHFSIGNRMEGILKRSIQKQSRFKRTWLPNTLVAESFHAKNTSQVPGS